MVHSVRLHHPQNLSAHMANSKLGGQETDYTPSESQHWENLTSFLAQLDATSSSSDTQIDFSQSWALTAFAWAFGGAEPTELAVRLACIWFVYDAEKLWGRVGEEAIHIHRSVAFLGFGIRVFVRVHLARVSVRYVLFR